MSKQNSPRYMNHFIYITSDQDNSEKVITNQLTSGDKLSQWNTYAPLQKGFHKQHPNIMNI